MSLNHVNYTVDKIQDLSNKLYKPLILLIGAEFDTTTMCGDMKATIIQPEPKQKIDDICFNYMNSPQFRLVDAVILPRVFEHFSLRFVDWYLYNISLLMKRDALLIGRDGASQLSKIIKED